MEFSLVMIRIMINKPFKVLYYNDENSYSRNHAIGMSYLNILIIEEDNQFECFGVLNGIVSAAEQASYSNYILENIPKVEKFISERKTIVHFIIAADFGLQIKPWNIDMFRYINSILKSSKKILITRIGSERLKCVQTEQYRRFYRKGDQINSTIRSHSKLRIGRSSWTSFESDNTNSDTDSDDEINSADVIEYKTEVYKSVGDDIEDFYNLIKMKQINCINPSNEPLLPKISLLDPSNSSKFIIRSFHLSLLTDQEESESFKRRFYKFKNNTALSENKEYYALSLCARKTSYITYYKNKFWADRQLVLFDIDELDPWQEKIKKNFQELKSRQGKIHDKALFNYWETDSDSDKESN